MAETLVPARLAQSSTRAANARGFSRCSPANLAHDPGDFSGRISATYHANYQVVIPVRFLMHFMKKSLVSHRLEKSEHTHKFSCLLNLITDSLTVACQQANPWRTEIDPGQRDASRKLAHHRWENSGRGFTSGNLSHALLILRVDHTSSSGKHIAIHFNCFTTMSSSLSVSMKISKIAILEKKGERWENEKLWRDDEIEDRRRKRRKPLARELG